MALDGFEEMFVESAAGDAISSLGNLLRRLDSSGQVVVAARKAFFRYKNLDTQSRIWSSFGDAEVEFADLRLHRWGQEQFDELANRAGLSDGGKLRTTIASALSEDHPLLTRAVLVRRLIEEFKRSEKPRELLQRLAHAEGERYFEEFVTALLEREVHEKWVDRAGEDAASPLLSVDEHHILLAMIAEEMWQSRVDALSDTMLETLAELVAADALNKTPMVVQQVKRRIMQHALLVPAEAAGSRYQFDHEDFKNYYLGRRLAEILCDEAQFGDLRDLLSHGMLPEMTIRTAISVPIWSPDKRRKIASRLSLLAATDAALSFTRSNCGRIAVALLHGTDGDTVVLEGLHFPQDTLRGCSLSRVDLVACSLERSSLEETSLRIRFERCNLERLEFPETAQQTLKVKSDDHSLPRAVAIIGSGDAFEDQVLFNPCAIQRLLTGRGWLFPEAVEDATDSGGTEKTIISQELKIALRGLRLFLRNVGVNENTFRMRLGASAPVFFGSVLPGLLQAGVVRETRYRGSGVQSRYCLVADLTEIEAAKVRCDGTFQSFLEALSR